MCDAGTSSMSLETGDAGLVTLDGRADQGRCAALLQGQHLVCH